MKGISVSLTSLFFKNEGPNVSLTPKHWAILAALDALGPVGACCADLQRKIAADCDEQQPRIATLYSLLLDLESKGLLKPFDAVMAANGGRPRRLYVLTGSGRRALKLGEMMAQRLEEVVAQSA